MPELPFSQLENYKVEHLLLPVGFNPLPNAVAGPLLVRDGGQITLMHTGKGANGGTKEVAENYLQPILERRLRGRNVTVSVHVAAMDESRISSIRKEVYAALDKYPAVSSVGLHYTAGTKAMSAHAHRFVKAWAAHTNKPHPRLTYLSAREIAIFVDPETDEGTEDWICIAATDASAPQVTLEDMLRLHGGVWSKTIEGTEILPEGHPEMVDAAKAIAKINYISRSTELARWTTMAYDKDLGWTDVGWKGPIANKYDKVTRWIKDDDSKPEKRAARVERELRCMSPISLTGCPNVVAKAFREALRLPSDATHLNPVECVAARRIGSVTAFYAFVHGTWLESYAMWAMYQASNRLISAHKLGLHDLYRHVEPSFTPIGPKKFEVDVVGIRGYQLFGISCAIEAKLNEGEGKAKWKLFEAITRARQLGGDEARIAFVSLLGKKDAATLVDEAAGLLQFQNRVKAFGRADLETLPQKFEEWIKFA